jgi:hypothetical protein
VEPAFRLKIPLATLLFSPNSNVIRYDNQKVDFIRPPTLEIVRDEGMYVKTYNVGPLTRSTMVIRKARSEGFDLYMPLVYRDTCIPYRNPE